VSRIETRLHALGLALPEPLTGPDVTFNFKPVKVHAGVAYISGHGPFDGPNVLVQGLSVSTSRWKRDTRRRRLVALWILASLKQELGDLDRVTQWIRAVGYIYSEPGFGHNAAVLNGFSDLIVELWGDAGRHARSAPGQGPSPFNVPVIVDAIAAVE